MRISDWSSDVCSSDLGWRGCHAPGGPTGVTIAHTSLATTTARPISNAASIPASGPPCDRRRPSRRSRSGWYNGITPPDSARQNRVACVMGRALRQWRDSVVTAIGQIDDSAAEIGRAHVWTPVTNAHLVCRLLLEKKKKHK